jgi:putative oxidoreductase
MGNVAEVWTPRMLSVFRIVVALLYLQHPLAKFFAFPHVAAFDNLQRSRWSGWPVSSNSWAVPCFWSAEAAVFFCFAFLYLAFAGPGPWSVDHLWRRRSVGI